MLIFAAVSSSIDPIQMKQQAIYTVLTGNYDLLAQPQVVDPSYDYICFTDRDGQDGVWQLRKIPFESANPVLRARYVKLHPHELLPEYDRSVYMDANLCIVSEDFYGKVSACGTDLAVLEHPERDCVYDELRYCYLKEKVGTQAAFAHLRRLREMGMPPHAGLAETNVLLRRHNKPEIIALDQRWWDLLLSSQCTRDQLCFTPALHLSALRPALLLGPGLNARNVPCIKYTLHPRTGKENTPGKLNWANASYHLRLGWRKLMLRLMK